MTNPEIDRASTRRLYCLEGPDSLRHRKFVAEILAVGYLAVRNLAVRNLVVQLTPTVLLAQRTSGHENYRGSTAKRQSQ